MSSKNNTYISEKLFDINKYRVESKNSIAKPFLKWAGGKTQILNEIDRYLPIELKEGKIRNYFEPFLGGGAVFFYIIQNYNIEKAFLFDINAELILVFKAIQKNVESVISFLRKYQKEYISLNEIDREKYFYNIRTAYNVNRFDIDYENYSDNWSSRAAQMIFLNKTCFNGLFRINKRGEFNVPFGRYKNPSILNDKNLFKASSLLKNVIIESYDFEILIKYVTPDSFVYFDPPYKPISKTSNFTSYSKIEFDDKQQERLAKTYQDLNELGCKLMLSNSDPKNHNKKDNYFDNLYTDFNIYRIKASRMINCVGEKRGKINELIITNY